MRRQLWLAPFGLFTIFALFAALGCDEPNDPDLPPSPYRLAAIYDPGSPIIDISTGGDSVAVGVLYKGLEVLNVADPNAISLVDTIRFPDPGSYCQAVALDAVNSLVAMSSTDFLDPNLIRDFANDTRVSGFGATGVTDMQFYSRPDTSDFWFALSGTDVRISNSRFVRIDSVWSLAGGCSAWAPGLAPTVRMEQVAIRSDGIVAVAFQSGVHLINSSTCQDLDTIQTPDQAYGCAWYGDYLIVAAEYHMLVIDLSDLQNAAIIQRFEIRNADRLRQVAVDGNFAALLDTNDGIYIVDISNVTASKLVQTITLIQPSSVASSPGRFYFADQARGLLIYTR
jgi:hypothetical protein